MPVVKECPAVAMKRISLHVETLGCEADETQVLDDLLAHEGVLTAEIDLIQETLALAYDEHKTSKAALLDHLRFFGIVQHREALPNAS